MGHAVVRPPTRMSGVDHVPEAQLRAGLDQVRRAPSDVGTIDLIALRPADGERDVVEQAEADVRLGMMGDNWSTRSNRRTPNGGPSPKAQVTVMSARAAALIAGPSERWALAGDQLYVDFDLSETNVPAGTRLAIGEAVLEVTDQPHNGCAKFRRRFGEDAVRFVNSPEGKHLHLRGINTKVVESGAIRRGDKIRKA
jgi:hypothetical protein